MNRCLRTCVLWYFDIIPCVCYTASTQSGLVSTGGRTEQHPVQLDSLEKRSYTAQAAKRNHCQRLTKCVYCIRDYTYVRSVQLTPSMTNVKEPFIERVSSEGVCCCIVNTFGTESSVDPL